VKREGEENAPEVLLHNEMVREDELKLFDLATGG
jgi:hypothetical protein